MFLQNANATPAVTEAEVVNESIEMLFADMVAVVQESEAEWQNIQSGAFLAEHVAILAEDAEAMKANVGKFVEGVKKWFAKAYAAAKTFFAKVVLKIKDALGVDAKWLAANRPALAKATGSVTIYAGVADGSAVKGFSALANKAMKVAKSVGAEGSDKLQTSEISALLGAKVKGKQVKGVDLLKQIGTVAKIGGSIDKLVKIVDVAAKGAQSQFKKSDKAAIEKAKVAYSGIQSYVGSMLTAYNGMRADLMAGMRGIISNKVADGKDIDSRKSKLADSKKARLAKLKAKNESVEVDEVLSESEVAEFKDLLLAEAMGTLEDETEVEVVEEGKMPEAAKKALEASGKDKSKTDKVEDDKSKAKAESAETEEASETSEVVTEGEEIDLFAEELAAE